MYLLLEYLFYGGTGLIGIGIALLFAFLILKKWNKLWVPSLLAAVGIILIVLPAFISQFAAVDLGPREKRVNEEVHLTLTGWEGENYGFLSGRTDVVVLQMANEEVEDKDILYLSQMEKLRELDLNFTQITDKSLETLKELTRLERLRIRKTKITDQGFRLHLLELPNLKQIDLRETEVSKESIDEWKSKKEGRRAMQ